MARARAVTGLHPQATLRENARAIVAVRVAEMYSFADAVDDPTRDEDLHNMRIAAKRLRYTLEMFRVCLGSDGDDLIDAVKGIQERIGTIHDADVLTSLIRLRLAVAAHRQVERIAEAAGSGSVEERLGAVRAILAGPDPRLGLASLMAHTDANREATYAAFVEWWKKQGGEHLRARLDSCVQ